MKYAIEIGPVAMRDISSFIKTGSAIEKFDEGIRRQHCDRISLPIFFKIRKAG
jgi:hypothetical protein